MKQCKRCRKRLPLDAFHREAASNDGRQRWCRQCRRDYGRNDPERARRATIKHRWGLSLEEYDRIRAAGCVICGLKEPMSQLCFDHDHANGKLRAVLCKACNIAIGYFEDDPARMRSAAAYVEDWKVNHAHA